VRRAGVCQVSPAWYTRRMPSKPFRFGLQCISLPPAHWVEDARDIEALGYSALYFPDHFGAQWDPLVGAAAVASVTTRLRVGTLVCDMDFRHPVVLAKMTATLQLASGGRLELGIGAGWMRSDYDQAGLVYDSHRTRIERLEEALEIVPAATWDGLGTTTRHPARSSRAASRPRHRAPRRSRAFAHRQAQTRGLTALRNHRVPQRLPITLSARTHPGPRQLRCAVTPYPISST